MELLLNLGLVLIVICAIVFFVGVVKLITSKDSNSKAIKMILFSLLTIVITLIIGVSVCFSNLRIGAMH